jgi:hypothetical protein
VGTYDWLVDALNDEITTGVIIGISVVAMDIGGIADAAAFTDVVSQGMRVHGVDSEFKSRRETFLQSQESAAEVCTRTATDKLAWKDRCRGDQIQ